MGFKVYDIVRYTPLNEDRFFLDNSVWMYLYCPLGKYEYRRQVIYSKFFNSILKTKSHLYISSLVLSEFINRWLKFEFNHWKKENNFYQVDFKRDFVGTSRYNKAVKVITNRIEEILKLCNRSSDNFNELDIERLLTHFQNIDFNDSYYIELSSLDNFKIVTDDKDFIKYTNHDVEVLTFIK
jgi:hypothetical protein